MEVDWFFERRACAMCRRAREYFERRGIPIRESVDADEHTLTREQVSNITGRIEKVSVARGASVSWFDMKSKPPARAALLESLLAPSGNLRAPAVVAGGHLLVGFHDGEYRRVFG